jgi:hypothetical protein
MARFFAFIQVAVCKDMAIRKDPAEIERKEDGFIPQRVQENHRSWIKQRWINLPSSDCH